MTFCFQTHLVLYRSRLKHNGDALEIATDFIINLRSYNRFLSFYLAQMAWLDGGDIMIS